MSLSEVCVRLLKLFMYLLTVCRKKRKLEDDPQPPPVKKTKEEEEEEKALKVSQPCLC